MKVNFTIIQRKNNNFLRYLLIPFPFLLTAIIRYLGSRFPETLSATDDENRTALHYAATIKDNGHFYNLLVTLGANPKAVDNVMLRRVFFCMISLNLLAIGDFLMLRCIDLTCHSLFTELIRALWMKFCRSFEWVVDMNDIVWTIILLKYGILRI